MSASRSFFGSPSRGAGRRFDGALLAASGLLSMGAYACGDETAANGTPAGASATTGEAASTASSSTGAGGATASSSSSASVAGPGGGGPGTGGSIDCGLPAAAPLPALKVTPVATELKRPVWAGSPPGDTTRLFIIEQHLSRVRIVENGTLLAGSFLDLGGCNVGVSCGDEQGLLGLAFHPDYAKNGRFFVNYTDPSGDTIVAEYARSAGNPNVADPEPKKVLLTIAQPYGNHNGGGLAFGRDGLLYIGTGDGGSAGDPQDNGQDLASQLGKMLRIDVDKHPTPPPGNLPGADPYVWDYGLRNPWRYSFDRCSGDLYVGDVGQNKYEEIHVERAGDGHKNYGWDTLEGTHCYEPSSSCDQTGTTPPVAEYGHADGCSVTGGFVYRGSAIPGLAGWYLYGDYCSSRVWALAWYDGALVDGPIEITDDLLPGLGPSISSFGEDASGELYLLDLKGTVYRIDPE